jgi:GAF domain-containing protein
MPLRDSDGRITHFVGVQTDVTEQTLSSQRLAEMLEVERVISSTSRLLTRRPGLSHRQNLDDALALIAKKLKLDRVVILEFSDEEAVPRITHSYASGDLRAIPTPIEQNFPWYVDQLRHKRKVVIPSLESLPSEAKLEILYAERTGLLSHCAVPVIVGDIVLGSLSLSNYSKGREWPDHVLQRLELLCEIIGNTLARERGHNALVESEALMRSMADALPVCISFVDAQSRYRFNNVTYEQWFGVSRSELAGKKMERILGKQAYQTVKRYVERVLSGV